MDGEDFLHIKENVRPIHWDFLWGELVQYHLGPGAGHLAGKQD